MKRNSYKSYKNLLEKISNFIAKKRKKLYNANSKILGGMKMKLEQNEKQILFNTTQVPDIFFSEYLNSMPSEYVKLYLYLIYLSKYSSRDVKVNDISKSLYLPVNIISEGVKYLEENKFILRKPQGYLIIDLQEATLNELYKPNVQTTPEKLEQNAKNKERIQLVQYLNNKYFQGVMGPTWYQDIDTWIEKYGFDKQVLIALFDYCYKKSALHKNYVQAVAEAWGLNNIKNLGDLEDYYIKQDNLIKIKKSIAKKLGKHGGLTQYEEAYVENWVNDFKYDMNIIEIALKRTTFRSNISFEYLNNVITDWNERNLRTPAQVSEFLEKRKEQNKNEKALKKKVEKETFEQREYSNLSFLYANNDLIEGEGNG